MITKVYISCSVLPSVKQLGVEFVNLFASVLTTESAACHLDLHALLEGDAEIIGAVLAHDIDNSFRHKGGKVLARIEAIANFGGADLIKWRQNNKGLSELIEHRILTEHRIKVNTVSLEDNETELTNVFLAVAGFKESMYFICALDLKNFSIRVLLLDLAECLKTTGIDSAELIAPELKVRFRGTNLLDDLFSLVFGEVERIVDLDGLSLKVLTVGGDE